MKKYFTVAKGLVKIAKGLAAVTGTKVDDEILGAVESGINFLEPYIDEEWAFDLINSIIALFKKDGPAAAIAKLKEVIG